MCETRPFLDYMFSFVVVFFGSNNRKPKPSNHVSAYQCSREQPRIEEPRDHMLCHRAPLTKHSNLVSSWLVFKVHPRTAQERGILYALGIDRL